MEVHANKVEFLSPKGEQTQDAQPVSDDPFLEIKPEDIPF